MRRPLTDAEARARLRAACVAVGGQKRWAALHGFSQSHVSKALAGEKGLSARIVAPLGLVQVEQPELWIQKDAR